MSVSQNIICSAAELSHTCSISAPDGWVHNKFSSWSLDWKSHIKIDFLKVFLLRGTSSQWVSSYLPARTELLVFALCSSPLYPCKTPACFPLQTCILLAFYIRLAISETICFSQEGLSLLTSRLVPNFYCLNLQLWLHFSWWFCLSHNNFGWNFQKWVIWTRFALANSLAAVQSWLTKSDWFRC